MTGGIVAALVRHSAGHGHRRPPRAVTFAGHMGGDGCARADRRRAADGRGHSATRRKHNAAIGPAAAGVIARQPRYIVAALTAMLAYGIMMLVMTATPVAMLGCGFSVQDSSWVIQWHALAMFVPSFFTGSLIARYGAEKISAIGMVLLVGAAVVGPHGHSLRELRRRADPAGPRLELRLPRRHDDADRDLRSPPSATRPRASTTSSSSSPPPSPR